MEHSLLASSVADEKLPFLLHGRVLIVAGSDSGGGAGIQGDLKTVSALGGFASTAITALTAQNSLGVQAVYPVSTSFIQQQMRSVLTDLGADLIKTGMLATGEIIQAVCEILQEWPDLPVIVDPVMVAKGGHCLLASEAIENLRRILLPRALLITPNAPEAEALLGRSIQNTEQMEYAAQDLLAFGPEAVLLKGGHIPGKEITNLLLMRGEKSILFRQKRFATQSTHGTGCATASAIAAGLAQGFTLETATHRALAYVHKAIETAPKYGKGYGPLNHFHNIL